jgi:hypothetical protein
VCALVNPLEVIRLAGPRDHPFRAAAIGTWRSFDYTMNCPEFAIIEKLFHTNKFVNVSFRDNGPKRR